MNSVFFHKIEKPDLYNTANLTMVSGTQRRARERLVEVSQGVKRFRTAAARQLEGLC